MLTIMNNQGSFVFTDAVSDTVQLWVDLRMKLPGTFFSELCPQISFWFRNEAALSSVFVSQGSRLEPPPPTHTHPLRHFICTKLHDDTYWVKTLIPEFILPYSCVGFCITKGWPTKYNKKQSSSDLELCPVQISFEKKPLECLFVQMRKSYSGSTRNRVYCCPDYLRILMHSTELSKYSKFWL